MFGRGHKITYGKLSFPVSMTEYLTFLWDKENLY